MRILHFSSLYAPYYVGGAERVIEVLAAGLASRGFEVAVAHLAPQADSAHERDGVAVYPLAHRNPLWIEKLAGYPAPIRNANKLATLFNVLTTHDAAALIDHYRPDIVHTHSMVELPPFIWSKAKQRGVKIVHTLQDFDLLCIRAALFKDGHFCTRRHHACKAFSLLKKACHKAIDSVVGASRSILDIHRGYGFFDHIAEDHRHVVWNPAAFEVTAPEAQFRSGHMRFGFLGRIVPDKGIEVLLDACRTLSGANWELKIAGRAPRGEEGLRRRAEGMPVSFLGFVNPPDFFKEIDVLVAPILWSEPFGMTVVEALAAGVPVIGSRLAGVAEVLGSVESDWLVPPGDVPALAALMREIIQNGAPDVRSNPKIANVLLRTSHEYVVDRYVDVYNQLIGV
jgi:glycogen(starch) synthase